MPTEVVGLPQTFIAALHTDDLPLQFNGNDFEMSAEVLNDLLEEATINISFDDIDTSRCNNENALGDGQHSNHLINANIGAATDAVTAAANCMDIETLMANPATILIGRKKSKQKKRVITKESHMTIKQRCSHGIDSKRSYGSYFCNLVSDTKCKELMTEFWSLPGWLAKKTYIRGLVSVKKPKIRRLSKVKDMKNKKISRDCFLIADSGQRVNICQSLFWQLFLLVVIVLAIGLKTMSYLKLCVV